MNHRVRTCIGGSALLVFLGLFSGLFTTSLAASDCALSKGQTLYVPVYSNILSAPKRMPFNLAALLSIRNTDMKSPIRIISADYYDTKGKLSRKYYDSEITLAPLESTYLYLPEDDTTVGIGATFIVRWTASTEVNMPIVECVMIGMKGGQGISFVSHGQVIKESSN